MAAVVYEEYGSDSSDGPDAAPQEIYGDDVPEENRRSEFQPRERNKSRDANEALEMLRSYYYSSVKGSVDADSHKSEVVQPHEQAALEQLRRETQQFVTELNGEPVASTPQPILAQRAPVANNPPPTPMATAVRRPGPTDDQNENGSSYYSYSEPSKKSFNQLFPDTTYIPGNIKPPQQEAPVVPKKRESLPGEVGSRRQSGGAFRNENSPLSDKPATGHHQGGTEEAKASPHQATSEASQEMDQNDHYQIAPHRDDLDDHQHHHDSEKGRPVTTADYKTKSKSNSTKMTDIRKQYGADDIRNIEPSTEFPPFEPNRENMHQPPEPSNDFAFGRECPCFSRGNLWGRFTHEESPWLYFDMKDYLPVLKYPKPPLTTLWQGTYGLSMPDYGNSGAVLKQRSKFNHFRAGRSSSAQRVAKPKAVSSLRSHSVRRRK